MLCRSAVAALLFAVGTAPAEADFASEALLHSFVQGIDASPDWSASAGLVRSEGADTIGERLVLSRVDPDVSVTIDRLRLRALQEGTAGGFSAAEIEMTGTALVSEDADVDIPAASVRDVSVPSAEGLLYDPRQLMSFVGRLYSILAEAEFSQFSIPEMFVAPRPAAAGVAGADGTTGEVIYRNLTVAALRDGMIEQSQAGPISFEGQGPEGPARFDVQSVSTERVDVSALAHIFDPASYRDGRGDGVWRPLVSKIGYSGLSAAGPKGVAFRLNEFALENIEGRQPDKPFTRIWDRILDPAVPEQARADLALEAFRDIASAWRLGTMRMDQLALDAPEDGASAGLGALTTSGLSNEGIDSVIVKNVRADGPEGFARVDNLELAGLVFPDTEALIQFAALESRASSATHNQTMREAFAGLPRLSHFGFQGLSAGTSPGEAVSIGLFSLDFRNWHALFAGETDMRLEGFDVPVNLMQLPPEQRQVMDTLGFDRLVLGMSLSDRWSPETGTDNATWTFSLKDGAEVKLSYALAGLTEAWVLAATAAAGKGSDSQAALAAMLNDLRLERASLAVTDRSLLDRAFAVAAQKQGLSVDGKAYREQMRGALPFLLSAALPAEIAKLVTAPLQAFMAGGQTLIAEVAPAGPVPLMELAAGLNDPFGLVTRLGVAIRSEAPTQ